VLPSGSLGALLVSPFNVKWRCYAQAGGVEESKFCLFLVVFPLRYISCVSPRFYFRRHAFCFFPVAAILESSNYSLTCEIPDSSSPIFYHQMMESHKVDVAARIYLV
jgi:hypothetical protein